MRKKLGFWVFGGVIVLLYGFVGKISATPGFNDVPWVKSASVDTSHSSSHLIAKSSVKAEWSINLPDSMANKFDMCTYAYAWGEASESQAGKASATVRVKVAKMGFSVLSPFMLKIGGAGNIQGNEPWGAYTDEYGLTNIDIYVGGIGYTIFNYYQDFGSVGGYFANICTTITNGTITGVGIRCMSKAYTQEYHYGGEAWNRNHFRIDNISVEHIGIEEASQNSNIKTQISIWPNPFISTTVIRYSSIANGNSGIKIKIYDISGNIVEETDKTVIGKNLKPGIYYVRAGDYKPVKIVKMAMIR